MSERPALGFLIGDDELRAIGHVAAQWSFLEAQIDWCIYLFVNQPSTKHLSNKVPLAFKRRAKLWREAAALVFANRPDELSEIEKIIDDSTSLRGQRDEIIHGIWRYFRPKGKAARTGVQVVRQHPSFSMREVHYPLDRIERVAFKISRVTLSLIDFLND